MQNSKPENNIVSQFVDKSVITAMKAVFAEGLDKIPAEEAMVIADGDNFSLAIGKKGQNVKLASRLTK